MKGGNVEQRVACVQLAYTARPFPRSPRAKPLVRRFFREMTIFIIYIYGGIVLLQTMRTLFLTDPRFGDKQLRAYIVIRT